MEFIFIRPELLWLLLPWFILTTVQFAKRAKQKHSPLIAPHLANIMLSDAQQQRKTHSPLLIAVFMLITIICAAGPSFEKQQVPVFQTKQARVVLMDMSYSMYSTDIAPNRLTQARFKTLDMIELFKEGDTALVAYAGDAFTVSPLTSDAQTLSNLIPSLSPEIMPSKGSNVLAGLDQSISLLKQAGYQNGEIVLITDGLDQDDVDDIRSELKSHAYTLHIYAVGTEQGAPIALPEGGFLKDNSGQIVVPKLNVPRLSNLARSQNGQFAAYSTAAHDLTVFKPQVDNKQLNETRQSEMLWRIDAGHYGLLILLPLALLLIRKAGLTLSVMALMLLPNEQVYAADWQTWFKNTDQNALSAFEQEQFSAAASADNLALKGAALYKQGQFEEAANVLKNTTSAIGQYNYANALAKSGQLEAALEAYDSALKQDPEFQQALDNKKLVEDLHKQQQEQSQDQQQNQDQQNNEQQDNADSDEQQSDGKQSDKQSSDEQQQSEQDKSNSSDQNTEGQNNSPDMQSDAKEPQDEQQKQDSAQAQQNDEQKGEEDNLTEQEMQAQQQAQQNAQKQEQNPENMGEVTAQPLTPEEKEKAQQLSQLLRKVPDDPAILLRNKMQLEAQQRAQQRRRQGVEKSW
ncbi:Ca-activated chloride channel protein [Pseudoalteromonas citrea]|uniref:Ca-activated chloride channel protein n=2 Tax=Pseudoalteromonas citrea TaxID=43655 RepID=A0AAD4AM51_9GAMM|nr:VWA domain-containing protein [Pseudoalteromonas citrea]KAF7775053.1 Ca-activated chloride channel protein [Pseudoalteromonas citrea]